MLEISMFIEIKIFSHMICSRIISITNSLLYKSFILIFKNPFTSQFFPIILCSAF